MTHVRCYNSVQRVLDFVPLCIVSLWGGKVCLGPQTRTAVTFSSFLPLPPNLAETPTPHCFSLLQSFRWPPSSLGSAGEARQGFSSSFCKQPQAPPHHLLSADLGPAVTCSLPGCRGAGGDFQMHSHAGSLSLGPEPPATLICPLFLCSIGVEVPADAFLPAPQGELRGMAYTYPPHCPTLYLPHQQFSHVALWAWVAFTSCTFA